MSNEIPKIYVEADIYEKLPSITKSFYLHEFEYYFYVHLPEYIARHFTLYQVDKLVDNDYDSLPDIFDYISHDSYHPWVQFLSGVLDKTIGQHIYRLSFVNTATHDTCTLYFSYIVHSKVLDEDAAYNYMERGCQCCQS